MPFFRKKSPEEQIRERIIRMMEESIGYSAPDDSFDAYGNVKWPEANLFGVDLSHLNMSFAGGTDLSRADLRTALLEDSNLNDAKLVGANLSDVRARGLFLNGADLSHADFTDADLRDAMLNNVTLGGAIFRRTNLIGARGFYSRDGGPPGVFEDCVGDAHVLQKLSNR